MKNKFAIKRAIVKATSAANEWAIYGYNPDFEDLYWKVRLADDITYFLRMKLDIFLRKVQNPGEPQKNFMIEAVYEALRQAKNLKKQFEKIDPKGRQYDPAEKALDEFLTMLMEFKQEIIASKESNIDDCHEAFLLKVSHQRKKAEYDMQTITGMAFQRSFKSICDAAEMFCDWDASVQKKYREQFGT